MGGDSAIRCLTIGIQFDRLSMAPVNPTIEVSVKVKSGELSMMCMGSLVLLVDHLNTHHYFVE